jgi:hypothetical protein
MKRIIKRVFGKVSPKAYAGVREVMLSRRATRIENIKRQLIDKFGLTVSGGPFQGMSYVENARPVLLPAKHVGAYEAELHGTINKIIQANYPVIVDVGCAEGYYAVGLAMKMPHATVYAFDIDLNGQQWCGEMAQANGVADRVIVGAACDHERLRQLPLKGSLVFSDCEGYELELLKPDLVPELKQCDLLVELHDEYDPSLTQTILSRFRATHNITLIEPAHRNVEEYAATKSLSAGDRRIATSDFRGDESKWAFMEAKSKA